MTQTNSGTTCEDSDDAAQDVGEENSDEAVQDVGEEVMVRLGKQSKQEDPLEVPPKDDFSNEDVDSDTMTLWAFWDSIMHWLKTSWKMFRENCVDLPGQTSEFHRRGSVH